jgi:cytochrome c oxidase subunit 2
MRVQVEAPGTRDGACAAYCGAQHAGMRVRLVAVPAGQVDAWARGQAAGAPAPADDAGRRGLALFMAATCVNCHTVRGTPANATVGPDLTHLGSRGTLAAGALENTPDALRRWIANPRAAKPGALMPAYPNFTDAELSDLATYLEGLR